MYACFSDLSTLQWLQIKFILVVAALLPAVVAASAVATAVANAVAICCLLSCLPCFDVDAGSAVDAAGAACLNNIDIVWRALFIF